MYLHISMPYLDCVPNKIFQFLYDHIDNDILCSLFKEIDQKELKHKNGI